MKSIKKLKFISGIESTKFSLPREFFFFFALSAFFANSLLAACTYTSTGSGGAWNSATTWTVSGGGGCGTIPPTTLGNNDFVVISSNVTLAGNLVLNNGSGLTINGGQTLTVSGSVTMNGTSNVTDNGSLIAASFTNNGSNNLVGTGQISTSGAIIAGSAAIFGSFTDCPTGPCYTSDSWTLPIELLSFSGTCVEGANLLTWTTLSEHNNAFFEIERYEKEDHWEVIALIAGHVNSNETNEYSYLDRDHLELSYYRLTQIDLDGQRTINGIVTLECGLEKDDMKTFPNPSGPIFQVQISNPELKDTGMIRISDSKGLLLYQKEVIVDKGANSFIIDLNADPGVYYVEFISESGVSTIRKHILQ